MAAELIRAMGGLWVLALVIGVVVCALVYRRALCDLVKRLIKVQVKAGIIDVTLQAAPAGTSQARAAGGAAEACPAAQSIGLTTARPSSRSGTVLGGRGYADAVRRMMHHWALKLRAGLARVWCPKRATGQGQRPPPGANSP